MSLFRSNARKKQPIYEAGTISGGNINDVLNTFAGVMGTKNDYIPLTDPIRMVDPAHVCMASIIGKGVPPLGVIAYDENNNPKCVAVDELLALHLEDDEIFKVYISNGFYCLENEDNLFKLKLWTDYDVPPKFPALEYDDFSTSFTVDADLMAEAVKDSTSYDDHIRLFNSGQTVSLSAENRTDDGAKKVSKYGDKFHMKVPLDRNASTPEMADHDVMLPNDYLNRLKLDRVTDNVKVEFVSDYPITADWESGHVKTHYLLAPRIECDAKKGKQKKKWSLFKRR